MNCYSLPIINQTTNNASLLAGIHFLHYVQKSRDFPTLPAPYSDFLEAAILEKNGDISVDDFPEDVRSMFGKVCKMFEGLKRIYKPTNTVRNRLFKEKNAARFLNETFLLEFPFIDSQVETCSWSSAMPLAFLWAASAIDDKFPKFDSVSLEADTYYIDVDNFPLLNALNKTRRSYIHIEVFPPENYPSEVQHLRLFVTKLEKALFQQGFMLFGGILGLGNNEVKKDAFHSIAFLPCDIDYVFMNSWSNDISQYGLSDFVSNFSEFFTNEIQIFCKRINFKDKSKVQSLQARIEGLTKSEISLSQIADYKRAEEKVKREEDARRRLSEEDSSSSCGVM